ncbi:transcription factor HES-3 [Anolis carolinensis]|uniref:transcription factor HES-3 n=1 Tax=Anolis carolinensis TaxID=28377 RepID=UPI002F2B6DB9
MMEKKRRARINLSLEQLKAFLEKHYSHQIRKRKLEKADILELSVKYMESLQSLPPPPLPPPDFQANHFLCCFPSLSSPPSPSPSPSSLSSPPFSPSLPPSPPSHPSCFWRPW